MHTHRKHISRLHLPDLIPIFPQILHVPRQSRRIAAHIYDPLRLHLNHRIQYASLTSFSRWIDYDHICSCMFSRMLLCVIRIVPRQHIFCLPYKEFCICNLIDLSIMLCFFDCLRHDLHAIDFLCFLRKEKGNGSDSAVHIPDRLITGKSGVFQCSSLKHLCLHRIHLIERQW